MNEQDKIELGRQMVANAIEMNVTLMQTVFFTMALVSVVMYLHIKLLEQHARKGGSNV